MRLQKLIIFFSFIIFLSFTPKVFASTTINTDITENTTWNLAGSPYIVVNNISVVTGATLTIDPGVIVKFQVLASGSNPAVMSVYGKMIAEGAADNKIYLTSLWDDTIGGDTNGDGSATVPDPYTLYGDWSGIHFFSAEGEQSLKNIVLSHAQLALFFNNSTATIEGLETISNNADLSVYNNSSVSVSRLISENSFGSVYNNAANLILSDSIIENSLSTVGGGVNLSNNSHTIIQNTKISHYYKAGIYDAGGNTVNISNTEISNNYQYGIFVGSDTSFGNSQYVVSGLTIKGNTQYGAYNQATYFIDLRNVYWGDPSGPYHSTNPSGLGNKVSNGILFSPWLTSELIVKKTPVLIIPGVLGTDINKGADKLWLDLIRNFTDIGDRFMDPLQFNIDLTASDTSLTTGDIIRKPNILFNYTEGLIQEFKNQGYTEGISSNATLFTFPYDWRYGISGIVDINTGKTTVDLLKNKIDQIRTQTGSDKVDIIAHSTGGLLVKKYVIDHSTDNHIDKAVFVGVPNTGAPKAIKTLLQGDDFGIPWLADGEMKKIAENLPVVYDLSPSQQYFNTKGSYVKIINQEFFNSSSQDLDFNQTNSFLTNDHNLNNQALSNAHNLHTTDFDNFDMRNSGVNLYSIDGCKAGTLSKVIERRAKDIFGNTLVSYDQPQESPGDGTVPLESTTNLPINQGNKYYALKAEHSKMPSQDGIRQEIVNLISGSILNIGNSLITQDISQCKLNGKAISIYSPLDINITDQNGNHSGLASGAIQNDIPNADFEIMGDHKFVYLPDDGGQTYTVKINGTGTGTFILKEDEITNNQIQQTQVFSDIPVTTNLVGQVNLGTNNTTTLSLDTNGDGIIDQTIQPSLIIKDITPPQSTATLDGLMEQGGFYRSDVNISLSAMDQNLPNKEDPISGILSTQYNLDNTGYKTYISVIAIMTEGSHTLKFFSTDNAGNIEPEQTVNFTVDKTAPEFSVQFNLAAKDLRFTGIDNISSSSGITVVDNDTVITLSDQAGNVSQITLKDRNRKSAMVAEMKSLAYNNQTVNMSQNVLKFSWRYDKSGQLSSLKQTVKSKSNFSINAVYAPNSTQITGQDQTGKIAKTLNGLVLLKVFTKMGDLSWGY